MPKGSRTGGGGGGVAVAASTPVPAPAPTPVITPQQQLAQLQIGDNSQWGVLEQIYRSGVRGFVTSGVEADPADSAKWMVLWSNVVNSEFSNKTGIRPRDILNVDADSSTIRAFVPLSTSISPSGLGKAIYQVTFVGNYNTYVNPDGTVKSRDFRPDSNRIRFDLVSVDAY